jgi:hypothetical protein
MSGAIALLMGYESNGSSGGGFMAVIETGASARGNTSSHTFGTITPTITGGSGSYTYSWTVTTNEVGVWTPLTSTASAITPAVSGVPAGNIAHATYVLVVTDTMSGKTATSNTASLSFFNTTPD